MEQMRLLLAIVLSFLVFVVWQWLVVEPEMAQQVQEPTTLAESASQPEDASDKAKPIEETPSVLPEDKMAEVVAVPTREGRKARTIQVKTPLYTVTLSEKGAVLDDLILNH